MTVEEIAREFDATVISESALEVDPDGMCVGYDAASGQSCSSTRLEVVVGGCEHEHLGPRSLCRWHAGDLRRGNMVCGDCLDHPARPHRCPLVVVS